MPYKQKVGKFLNIQSTIKKSLENSLIFTPKELNDYAYRKTCT